MAITKAALARQQEREAAVARREAQSEGARNRWSETDPAEALAARQRAAAAVNSPAGLARRIAKRWPDLDNDERAEVRAILAEAGVTGPAAGPPWQQR